MHKFLRAVGFSKIKDRKELTSLITSSIQNAQKRNYVTNNENMILAEFSRDFAEGIGISVCGEFDDDDILTALCSYLIRNEKTDKIYGEYFAGAIERELTARALAGLRAIPHVRVLGSDRAEDHRGILAFLMALTAKMTR